ncbi:hypothetical protein [Moheibacter sp.]|uniref:hypothetical protein n=1 Tax=Moheibacter sp. TaxID=1965316 RepID=UPI003C727F4F
MENIDYRMWIGIVIHALISLLQLANPEPILFYFTAPFVLLNILGLIFIVSNKIKTGCILFMIGSAAFIPIGLIGFFGARSLMNKLKQQDFYSEINSIGNESN